MWCVESTSRTKIIVISARSTPFVIGFTTDASELVTTGTASNVNEEILAPGGITGFRLDYEVRAC